MNFKSEMKNGDWKRIFPNSACLKKRSARNLAFDPAVAGLMLRSMAD